MPDNYNSTLLCGIVILYHPQPGLINNIRTYLPVLDKLWLVDNSEDNIQSLDEFTREWGNKVEVWQDGENEGIGYRINQVIEQARAQGFTWLLTMDQDSFFAEETISLYLNMLHQLNPNQKTALLGIPHHNEPRLPASKPTWIPAETLITSGTWINLAAIPEIGLMREDLFIDEVDTEFCYRARVHGWQLLVCEGLSLVHSLGARVWVRSVKSGKKTNRGLHSPLRLYYMTRNFLWVKKQYGHQFPEHFKQRTASLLNTYKNNLLYNDHRFRTLYMIYKGYIHFKQGKLGKWPGN